MNGRIEIYRLSKDCGRELLYKDAEGNLYRDPYLRDDISEPPHSVCRLNDWGDEAEKIENFVILNPPTDVEVRMHKSRRVYNHLACLQSDVKYYLDKVVFHCPYKEEWGLRTKIEKMKELYLSLDDDIKPDWLPLCEILSYEMREREIRTEESNLFSILPRTSTSEQFLSGCLNIYMKKYRPKQEEKQYRYTYMMLSRLKSDCEYYFGWGMRGTNRLWAGNMEDQIKEMRTLYNSIPDYIKPHWISMEDIDEYERKEREGFIFQYPTICKH